MKLSPAQKQVLVKMEAGKWYSAYDLQVRISTLEALRERGLLDCRSGLGSIFSPRTDVLFRKRINQKGE